MIGLRELLSGRNDPLTFEQDLELLCARWQDRSRKGLNAMDDGELAAGFRAKAEQLEGKPISSQGA